jgi:phosphoenolpyruvate synthase/pyruvate phosphate dikinase
MELIRDFRNLSKKDVAIAGGKGASLGEMTRIGLSVPPGFVILSDAFERFLEANDLNIVIDSSLRSVNKKETHTINKASEKIRTFILQAKIPQDIADKIQVYFKKLDAKYVAVRSSATAEDSVNAAWAGQLESYLNTTEKNLLENVKKCWASLFTPRAIFYRFEKDLHKQKISVAVVVQKMVKSEVSGIIFSVHPVTQDKNQLIIEAGFGLGEAIVSGEITPDNYVVDKNNLYLLDKNINKQTNASKEKSRRTQKLSDREIIKLAKIAVKIEKHYSFPVDIEWAKVKNNFYIIQSRPITTIQDSTLNNQNIFNYIKSQRWFLGVRADESLLFYSTKIGGYKYIKQEYGISFAETLLVPFKQKYPIRIFNLRQANNFHSVSNDKILRKPEILSYYVKEDNAIYQKIETHGKKLLSALKKGDYNNSVKFFNEIISIYEKASANFIIIFSLGLKLTENINKLNNIRSVMKQHDIWRNSVAFKEETMGENLFYFFEYLVKRKQLKINPLHLMKSLTVNEVKLWLQEGLTDVEIMNKIRSRENHGFVYLNLRNESREIIDNLTEIKKIKKYFLKLDRESKKIKNGKELSGQVAFNIEKLIIGKAIVIKDKSELKSKSHLIDGNILVATQTTPHFIPYMRKVKAIITDEGGLTCHAAIIAREFKIPCIIGVKVATQILKDNDIIEINTNNGTIRIRK